MPKPTPKQQLATFIARYDPAIAKLAKGALVKLRTFLPTAVELVYDNYNALAIGFGPTERASEGVFAIVLYPRWVQLYFLQGAKVPDPDRLLQGKGSRGRYLLLESTDLFDEPRVQALLDRALTHAKVPFPASGPPRLIIKSISETQRPRRPS